METLDENLSLVSNQRLDKILSEADSELKRIQPEIDYLEECVLKLNDLKLKKNKLLSLVSSIKVILNQTNVISNTERNAKLSLNNYSNKLLKNESININLTNKSSQTERDLFLPDLALEQVKQFIRTKNNLNYEIFRAVVYNAGEASTEEIKNYLVQNKIRQPKTGRDFDEVALKDISSRANYLVRKNLLISTGPGIYRSTLGYSEKP